MSKKLSYIVLLEPENPENTGLIARLAANYNYGLRIVNPGFNLSEARNTASGYQEKLREAEIFDSFKEAITGLDFVVGTKPGKGVEVSEFTPRQNTSIVVGRESSGLTNEELDMCDSIVHINTPGESSLNQATATAIFMDRMKDRDSESMSEGQKQHLEKEIDSKVLRKLVLRSNPSRAELDRLFGEL